MKSNDILETGSNGSSLPPYGWWHLAETWRCTGRCPARQRELAFRTLVRQPAVPFLWKASAHGAGELHRELQKHVEHAVVIPIRICSALPMRKPPLPMRLAMVPSAGATPVCLITV